MCAGLLRNEGSLDPPQRWRDRSHDAATNVSNRSSGGRDGSWRELCLRTLGTGDLSFRSLHALELSCSWLVMLMRSSFEWAFPCPAMKSRYCVRVRLSHPDWSKSATHLQVQWSSKSLGPIQQILPYRTVRRGLPKRLALILIWARARWLDLELGLRRSSFVPIRKAKAGTAWRLDGLTAWRLDGLTGPKVYRNMVNLPHKDGDRDFLPAAFAARTSLLRIVDAIQIIARACLPRGW
jgi:hypothetical protein